MKNKCIHILIFISSQKTQRFYLNLLKDYLHKTMPDADINYFISQHDDKSAAIRQSAFVESKKLNKDIDIFIGLDGNISKKILQRVTGKKILFYLPEVGIPRNKKAYLSGYDYFVSFDKKVDNIFQTTCDALGINIIKECADPFQQELCDNKTIITAKKKLYAKYPQLKGKKILSVVTRGKLNFWYRKKYKQVEMEKMIEQLPKGIVFMTNCKSLLLSCAALPQKYANKIVFFERRQMLEVLMASTWIFSNMAISWKCQANNYLILYEKNEFEKHAKKIVKPIAINQLANITLQKASTKNEVFSKNISDVLMFIANDSGEKKKVKK